jgi:hypothetical protein
MDWSVRIEDRPFQQLALDRINTIGRGPKLRVDISATFRFQRNLGSFIAA